MTVVALDQSFDPFDVDFGSADSVNWKVNLKGGTCFTFLFNDATGYGKGGTGGEYCVNSTATEDTSCLVGGPEVTHTKSDVPPTPTETQDDGKSNQSGGGGLSK